MTKPRTGTLTERAPGIWRLQVTADPDPVTGEVRRLSRTVRGTRAQATEDLQRLVVDAGAGLYLGSRVTVAELLAQFMTTATLAPTTREDWASVIRKHLAPELGALPLVKLTARDCDGLYVRMASRGIGPSRVRCAHVVLHRAVAQAVRWGWLARNPVSAATRPAVPRVSITPPDVDPGATGPRGRPPIGRAVGVLAGGRRCDRCPPRGVRLRWCDIDLVNATARLERSVCATRSAGVVIKTTKTDRARLVSLTRRAVHVVARRYEALMAGDHAVDREDLVFSTHTDARRPSRPELITRRWERLRTEVGCRDVRIHDLRHFVATELLTAGIDVRTVANRLGHARTSTTLDIY